MEIQSIIDKLEVGTTISMEELAILVKRFSLYTYQLKDIKDKKTNRWDVSILIDEETEVIQLPKFSSVLTVLASDIKLQDETVFEIIECNKQPLLDSLSKNQ